MVTVTSDSPQRRGLGRLKSRLAEFRQSTNVITVFFSFEMLFIAVLFGVPIDAIQGIGQYSFYTNILFGVVATLVGGLAMSRRGWLIESRVFATLCLHSLFSFYCFLSLMQTAEPYHIGVQKVILIFAGGIWCFLGASIIASDNKRAYRFVWALFGFGMFFSVVNTIVPILQEQFLHTVLTTNYQHASRSAGLAVISGMALITIGRSRFVTKALLCVCVVLALVAQLSSGGRTGVGASFICLIVLAMTSVSVTAQGLSFHWRLGFLLIFGFAGVIAIYRALIGGWLPATIWRYLLIFENTGSINVSYANRVSRFSSAGEYFAASPFVGHGTGSWDEVSGEIDSYYPHNLIVELLVEQGLIGTILFAAVVLSCFVNFIKYANIQKDPAAMTCLLLFVFTLSTTMATGDLGLNLYLYGACGLLLYRTQQIKQVPNNVSSG